MIGSLLGHTLVMAAVGAVSFGILICSWLPAPRRFDPRPIDGQLDSPRFIALQDHYVRPDVVVGSGQRRDIGQALAGRLARDEAMERVIGERDALLDRAAHLQTYAVELARHLVALGEPVPAMPGRTHPVLDETEAGVR